jgi:hypothetical protein
MPCLAEIDLSLLSGRVTAIGPDGAAREVMFPDEINGSERVLLIPAPLPVTWIKSIIFQSDDDKENCEIDARDFNNVPLSDFKRIVEPKLFSDTSDMDWLPENLKLQDQDAPMDGPLAAGGMMAMLLHMANLGDLGTGACRLAFDGGNSVAESIPDPMISALGIWMRTGHVPENDDVSQHLFWGAIDKLVEWKSSNAPETALDVLVGHLELAADRLGDRMKQALMELAKEMRKLAGFSDSTISELFERHPKTFSRVVTLFFLRENCDELLEFKHSQLSETDYVAAGILFAARDGWLRLPLELRDHPGLQDAVSHRMAAMAHQRANSGITLGVPPNRPIPLRELFMPGPGGWSKAQKKVALELARTCKWSCIQTRVDLGKGDYRMLVDGKGVHILMAGEAKAVVIEVDHEKFFADFANERLSVKQDRKVRGMLGS